MLRSFNEGVSLGEAGRGIVLIPSRLVSFGGSPHIVKYKPWKLVSSISFESKEKAIEFEKYLKSGSGRVFVKKRFL